MAVKRASITVDNTTLYVHGIEQPKGQIVKKQGRIIVAKIPGHSYQYGFSSKHTSGYAPAEFQVWEFEKEDPNTDKKSGWAQLIISFPVRTKEKK